MSLQFANDKEAVDGLAQKFEELKSEIGKVIVGQEKVIETVLVALFSNGHSLLVGVPGLAKTLLVSSISEVLDLDFKRIQFTPDLMPSDITGAEVLDENRSFRFNRGPIFANIVLADEINRTPPKTQAALLEAMQEKSVTIGGHRHELPKPFFVLATQNPIEQEGTYPLPEAQLDRFMFNIPLDYPTYEEEISVVRQTTSDKQVELNHILNDMEILYFQKLVRKIPVADNVLEYAVSLVSKTRPNTANAPSIVNDFISWGAGPRASQYLIIGAKTHAAIHGKYSPDIEDVKAIASYVLRHRIVRNYKAEAEGLTEEAPEPIFDLRHYTLEELNAQPLRKELRTYCILSDISMDSSKTTQMVYTDFGKEKIRRFKELGEPAVSIGKDKWSRGQFLFYIMGQDENNLMENIVAHFNTIANRVNQHDLKQLDAAVYAAGEHKGFEDRIRETYALDMRIPARFQIAHEDTLHQMLWLAEATAEATNSVVIRKYPYQSEEQLSKQAVMDRFNDFGKRYVDMDNPDDYLIINNVDLPVLDFNITISDQYVTEVRGVWEKTQSFTGGAFASYAILNSKRNEIIQVDVFTLAPGEEKRNIMQKLSHIVLSAKVL
ncbi:unnamed protein product [Cyprideis torosa]|uniref:ATPase AAA-3 domain-containing protein n=1 Tax=Cyprideis torosa TaxID=163714 RepID=A0A7R8ZXJ0_9CRUS|nr:unnamed protein product [Cyprideis torosa]CAG0907198.1 unnamed protein product [Cyprideis torosa]